MRCVGIGSTRFVKSPLFLLSSNRFFRDSTTSVFTARMSSQQKPSLPSTYVKPDVWDEEKSSVKNVFGGMNRPSAKPRSDAKLPRGRHALQLYSLGTPNGQKVTALLEELHDLQGVEYDAWHIDIMKNGDQFSEGFTAANPNQKIPALVDYTNDKENGTRVFESGHILLYLAEKYGAFLPHARRTETLNWLFWLQGAAPLIGGGYGHFVAYAPIQIEYAIDRFTTEALRCLDVLERQLASHGQNWVIGEELTIADFAIVPWFQTLRKGYGNGAQFLQFDKRAPHVVKYLDRFLARPAVARGFRVNGFGNDAVKERHSADDFQTPKL